jgi:hypothetical protein
MTMTSRKLYRALADDVNAALAAMQDNKEGREGVAALARRMSDTLRYDNPRFRYDKFYEACGLTEWGGPKGGE